MPGDDVFAALLSRGRRPRSPALWDHSCVMAVRAAAVMGASLLLLYYTCGREGCSCNRSTRSEASPVIIGCLQRVRLSQKGAYVYNMCKWMHVWPPSYIHGLLKYMASSGPICVVVVKRPYMHLDAGTAIHRHSRYAAVTPPCTVYLLGGSGARACHFFFVIYTHSDRGAGSGARCVTASIDL